MRITKNLVLDTISKQCGVKREYIDLQKVEGFYYWSEKAGAVFIETGIYVRYLDDLSLDNWVRDFDDRMKSIVSCTDYSTLNEYIENIDWSI